MKVLNPFVRRKGECARNIAKIMSEEFELNNRKVHYVQFQFTLNLHYYCSTLLEPDL